MAALAAVGGGLMEVAPAAGAAVWTQQSVAAPALPNGQLTAVSCPFAGRCLAIGSGRDGSDATQPLVERRNGSGWIQQAATPALVGTRALSCRSMVWCMAVANGAPTRPRLVAARWDGAGSTVLRVPLPAGTTGSLEAVSCPARRMCVAVGSYINRRRRERALVERWNGRRWAAIAVSTPRTIGSSALRGVSCVSAGACTAVGSIDNDVLAARWTGGAWTARRVTLDEDAAMHAVSCPALSWCIAAGAGGNNEQPVGMVWRGRRWSEIVMPQTNSLGASFTGLSCVTPRLCMAAGSSSVDTNDQNGFADRWDGRRWSTQNLGLVSDGGTLGDVSCGSPHSCTTVGELVIGGFSAEPVTLAEHWDGRRWSTEPTIDVTGAAAVQLHGVSCASPSACTAVGADTGGNGSSPPEPLAERWDGSAWTLQSPAAPARPVSGLLEGVSCPAVSLCIAVGHDDADASALTEHWDGTTWTMVPNPAPPAAQLMSVSCTAPDACTAVGNAIGVNPAAALIERWDGSSWTVQPAPAPSAGRDDLVSVSCPTVSRCVAAGDADTDGVINTPGFGPLVEVWDGSSWTRTVLGPGTAGFLTGVSCAAADACTAVGYLSGPPQTTLAFTWDGTSWTRQPTPDAVSNDQLAAVSCVTAVRCMSVGAGGQTPLTIQPFAEPWDGASWTAQTVPVSDAGGAVGAGVLAGVSCPAIDQCVAVGTALSRGLAEIYR